MSNESVLKKFVVVQYVYRGPQAGSTSKGNVSLRDKDLDLLPKSWIFPENKKMICYYPPGDNVEALVKQFKQPDFNLWKKYTLRCLFNTDDYSIGDELCVAAKTKKAVDLSVYEDDVIGPAGIELENQIRREHLRSQKKEMDDKFNEHKSQHATKNSLKVPPSKTIKKQAAKMLNDSECEQTTRGQVPMNSNEKDEVSNSVDDNILDLTEEDLIGQINDEQEVTRQKRLGNVIQSSNPKKLKIDEPTRPVQTSIGDPTRPVQSIGDPTRSVQTTVKKNPIFQTLSQKTPFVIDQAVTTIVADNYQDDEEVRVNRADFEDLKRQVDFLGQSNRRIEKNVGVIQGDVKKIRHLFDKKNETLLDCEYLEEKYSIKCPIKSRQELDAYNKKLTEDKNARADIKAVIKNLIAKIDDASKGARYIAKQFLTRELAETFVVQVSRKGNKEVLKDTHPKFLHCISSQLIERYGIPKQKALSFFGSSLTRSKEWGGSKGDVEVLEAAGSDD